jgi:hypothetical protein
LAGDHHHDDNDNNDDNDDMAIIVMLHIPMHPTRASGEPSIGRRPSAGGVSATTSMTTIPMMMTTTPIGLHDWTSRRNKMWMADHIHDGHGYIYDNMPLHM